MSSEQTEFDPYLRWLGIRHSDRPINHYRLLGLELFESDADVIAAAADRQMSHVRRYQAGPFGNASQELLNELAAAKLVLLDDARRADYDARLVAVSKPLHQHSQGAVAPANRRKRTVYRLAVMGAVILSATILIGVLAWKRQNSVARPQSEVILAKESLNEGPHDVSDEALDLPIEDATRGLVSEASGEKPSTAGAEPSGSASLRDSLTEEGERTPPSTIADHTDEPNERGDIGGLGEGSEREDGQEDNEPNAPSGQSNGNSVHATLVTFKAVEIPIQPLGFPDEESVWRDVRLAIFETDFEAARSTLAEIAAKPMSDPERRTHQGLSEIVQQLEQFYLALDAAFAGSLSIGTRLAYGDSSFEVTSIDGDTIELRTPNGGVQSYGIATLPPLVASSIVAHQLDGFADLHKVLGVYWDFSHHGNSDRAEKLHWRHVRRLSDDDRRLRRSWQADPKGPADNSATAKWKVPSSRELDLARQRVEAIVPAEGAKATESLEKLLAYRKLPKHRRRDNAANLYVSTEMAIGCAVEINDVDTAIRLFNDLAHQFDFDATPRRLRLFKDLSRKDLDADASKSLAGHAIVAVKRAIDADDFATAVRYKSVCNGASRRSDDPATMESAKAIGARASMLLRESKNVARAQRTLSHDPSDAEANDVVGRFYCFLKGDFDVGLPYLVRSDDAALASLARRTCSAPRTGLAAIEVTDQWWDYAQQQKSLKSFEQDQVVSYCERRYRDALASLPRDERAVRARVLDRLRSMP